MLEPQQNHDAGYAANTKVLTYDGDVKMLRDLKVGDSLLGDDGRAVKITYLKDFKSTGVRKLAITKNQNQPLFATPEQPLAVRHAKGSKDRGGNRTKMPLEAPTTLAAAFKQYDDEYGSQAFETKAAKGSKVTYMIVAEDLDTLKELALRHMALLPKDVDSETMIVNTLLGL